MAARGRACGFGQILQAVLHSVSPQDYDPQEFAKPDENSLAQFEVCTLNVVDSADSLFSRWILFALLNPDELSGLFRRNGRRGDLKLPRLF